MGTASLAARSGSGLARMRGWRILTASVLLLLGAHMASAQCEPGFAPGFGPDDLGFTEPPPSTRRPGIITVLYTDLGDGPALYVGGIFSNAGSTPALNVAKWDGRSWSALGESLTGPSIYTAVYALAVYDDGHGPALYAGGRFTRSGATEIKNIAKWNGAAWVAMGAGASNDVYCLRVFDDGTGTALYAGGGFTTIDGVEVHKIARWNGTGWTGVGGGSRFGLYISDLKVYTPPGQTPGLYACGDFLQIGAPAVTVNHIARWDGVQWSRLGPTSTDSGVYGDPACMQVFGGDLYVGGSFKINNDARRSTIAGWNGTAWTARDLGLPEVSDHEMAIAFAIFDDGGGPALYAGGWFRFEGGGPYHTLIRRGGDGRWSDVAGAIGYYDNPIWEMVAAVDNGVPALFVGGGFETLGGQAGAGFGVYGARGALPVITDQPADTDGVLRGTVSIPSRAVGRGTLSYQWHKGVAPLADGGRISGAATDTLTISDLQSSDAGEYNVVVANTCGSQTSRDATLRLFCPADVNRDGTVDAADYSTFNGAFQTGDSSADYNGDGFVDGIDSDLFNNDFEAGC